MRNVAGVTGLLLATLAGDANAQSFGWLFDGGTRQVPMRRHHSRAAQPQAVPLPPPRPHLASEPPARGGDAASAAVPIPPPKPVDAGGAAVSPPRSAPSLPAAQTEPSATQTPVAPSGATVANPPVAPSGATVASPPVAPSGATAASSSVAPSGASVAFDPRSPADDPGCPTRLADRKVEAEPVAIGLQPDPRCTVVRPVRLSGLTLRDGKRVDFPDRPVIACETADAFSAYVADLLSPLAKGSLGAPVAAVWTGPGLECRSRDHVFGAKLSAHGQGLAVDIAQIKLDDGRAISVGAPTSPVEQAFESAARAGGCGYFHTTLGPGSDSYHRTHWHFDLEVRGSHGDTKYCH